MLLLVLLSTSGQNFSCMQSPLRDVELEHRKDVNKQVNLSIKCSAWLQASDLILFSCKAQAKLSKCCDGTFHICLLTY